MTTPRQIQDLVSDLMHEFETTQLEFEQLPSGVCFIWIGLNRREFVLEYSPKRGTGVSENFSDTPMFVGHDEAFDSLDVAISRFKVMLAAAAPAATSSTALVMNDKPISK